MRVRVKIEVAPWEPVVPRSDARAQLLGGLGGLNGSASR